MGLWKLCYLHTKQIFFIYFFVMKVDKIYQWRKQKSKQKWDFSPKLTFSSVTDCLKLGSGKNCLPTVQAMDIHTYTFEKIRIYKSWPYFISGNKYILSFVDHYSGRPEAFCLPDKSAISVAHILLEYIYLGLAVLYNL